MAVYLDNSRVPSGRTLFNRMIADTPGELHAMALAIGLPRGRYLLSSEGIPHYNVSLEKKAEALKRGALHVLTQRRFAMLTRALLARMDRDPQFRDLWLGKGTGDGLSKSD